VDSPKGRIPGKPVFAVPQSRLTLPEFVTRWKASTLNERAAAQSHFIDLCEILGQPHPAAADQSGESYRFEKHVATLQGGKGYADVWKRGRFAWEYKGKHKDLHAAYVQLANYREDLENPPLLVVCDQNTFQVHTNFTGTIKTIYQFSLDDLLSDKPTANCALPPLEVLRSVFTDPDELRPEKAAARVTEQAAIEIARLADSLESRGVDPEQAAHFLMRLLFCLFADSIGLLPDHLFRQMIEVDRTKPSNFVRKLGQLFEAMATEGNSFGLHDIPWFNGGLFADDAVFELNLPDMAILRAAAALDWSTIEPSIFGTLFERSLNPGKRSQLGAHYTSKDDILLIIDPVLIAPLQKKWLEVKAKVVALVNLAKTEKGRAAYTKLRTQMEGELLSWGEELAKLRILDPACGSGNFLYLALRRMLDLWKEVYVFAAEHGLPTFLPHQVGPSQLYGLETNVYAHELASVVVWIGYLQWLNDNGIGRPTEPILRKLDNIQHRDAILEFDDKGNPIEPAWPEADFIIGNPPFLGGKRLRKELGDKYVDGLFSVYEGAVAAESDLVVYWFEKARRLVETGSAKRVGLLATQAIRGGVNRRVLERIKRSGDIFVAWSDRDWVLDGAAVHVSIIGFDDGSGDERGLDGKIVKTINANLTSGIDVTVASALKENRGISFMGTTKGGDFDLPPSVALPMLAAPVNPNGRPNSDVVRPWYNASDITGRPRGMFIIDFGVDKSEEAAALYELPFEYLLQHVYDERMGNNREAYRDKWWIHMEPRPEVRDAVNGLKRFIITPRVSKHRLFCWADPNSVPDSAIFVFARDDDYFFGVLQSRVHEVWARSQGTQVREVESGFRYTPTSTFDTFPFPWPPGKEPTGSEAVRLIETAARELSETRAAWLNPPGTTDPEDLKKRTLTDLYDNAPSWLSDLHVRLDAAVLAAYGFSSSLSNTELLEQLLFLNFERAKSQA
jgi:type II restriction/modification system DNA methylase subunit YeeA